MVKILKNGNSYNFAENRLSNRIMQPKISTVLSGEFQKSIEKASSDQFPKYDFFMLTYNSLETNIKFRTLLNLFSNALQSGKYIKLTSGINLFSPNEYLLYNPIVFDESNPPFGYSLEKINDIIDDTNANVYFYYAETDSDYNFELKEKSGTYDYIKNVIDLDEAHIANLEINSFDSYKEMFYKTDHHWNYKGSYKGYNDIASMMKLTKILLPSETICFDDINSSGSKTRSLGNSDVFHEHVCMYEFNYPKFKIISDGEEIDEYGMSLKELKKLDNIVYANMYGFDASEIIFQNEEYNNKKNLLLYSNSYSNAVNKLLASHYKNTYVIDARYYKNFDMKKYIEDNNIDDVLILGNNMLLSDTSIEW